MSVLCYHLLSQLRGRAGINYSGVNSRSALEIWLIISGKLLPVPKDLLPQGGDCPDCQAGSKAGRNYYPHPRCFSCLACIRLSSLQLQLKWVLKDMFSASPLLWTLTCFFQSAVKALVASSKVIFTRLQSLKGNTQSCLLSILYCLFLLKIRDMLLYLCLSTMVIFAELEPHSF